MCTVHNSCYELLQTNASNPWTDVKIIMLSKRSQNTHCIYYFIYMKFRTKQRYVLFDCWVVVLCINVPQYVYPFACWTFGLFSVLGILNKHSCTKLLWTFLYKPFCGYTFSCILGKYLGVEFSGPQNRFTFYFTKKTPHHFWDIRYPNWKIEIWNQGCPVSSL